MTESDGTCTQNCGKIPHILTPRQNKWNATDKRDGESEKGGGQNWKDNYQPFFKLSLIFL